MHYLQAKKQGGSQNVDITAPGSNITLDPTDPSSSPELIQLLLRALGAAR